MTKRANKQSHEAILTHVHEHEAEKRDNSQNESSVAQSKKLTWQNWKNVLKRAIADINNNHAFSFAAALSYYFVMSLFPALIALAAIVSLLPIPDLFGSIMSVVSRAVPGQSMGLVNQVVSDVIRPHSGGLLSFGLLGSLYTVSTGFAEIIEAMDVAYDVPETRSFLRVRGLALGMAFLVGGMLVISFLCMTLGPHFFQMFADKIGIGPVFLQVWTYLRWVVAAVLVVLSVEGIYFLAPNVKQQFQHTLPGAILAVVGFAVLSVGLGFYFAKFANFNKTYGTLGGAIALLTWLYWTGFVVIMGAELNSEIIQERGDGKLPLKQAPPDKVKPVPSDAAQLAA